jgi:hypothetical protein
MLSGVFFRRNACGMVREEEDLSIIQLDESVVLIV